MLIKILFILIMATPAIAKNYIIEIADFSCKYCQQIDHYNERIKFHAAKNNDEFIFAPIAFDKINTAEPLFYYATRNITHLEKSIRNVLFEMRINQKVKMDDVGNVLDWYAINHPDEIKNVDLITSEIRKSQKDSSHIKAYIKAKRLAATNAIHKTPTYILINKKGEQFVITRPDDMPIKDYVEHMLNTYDNMRKQ